MWKTVTSWTAIAATALMKDGYSLGSSATDEPSAKKAKTSNLDELDVLMGDEILAQDDDMSQNEMHYLHPQDMARKEVNDYKYAHPSEKMQTKELPAWWAQEKQK